MSFFTFYAQTIHLSVNMRSPYIVIPEYGTLHRGGNVVVLDLGKLKVESELQPKNLSMKVGYIYPFNDFTAKCGER